MVEFPGTWGRDAPPSMGDSKIPSTTTNPNLIKLLKSNYTRRPPYELLKSLGWVPFSAWENRCNRVWFCDIVCREFAHHI